MKYSVSRHSRPSLGGSTLFTVYGGGRGGSRWGKGGGGGSGCAAGGSGVFIVRYHLKPLGTTIIIR